MQLGELFVLLTLDNKNFNSQLNDSEAKARSFGDGVKNTVTTAARWAKRGLIAMGVETTKFAKDSIETGEKFDATMSKVKAISGASEEEFAKLNEKAKEMGATTVFTAAEAAEAFTYMGMAGWKTEDMLSGIQGIMNLAAASGENLGTVSDIVTDALTAFGLTSQDTSHFVDVLAAAATNSNTNVAMMGESFKYVAPLAGTLGYSIDDVAVALGLMANNGIKSSQAGTSLRQILQQMIAGSEATTLAMEQLNLSLYDSNGRVKTFKEVMGDMRTAFRQSGFDLAGKTVEEIQAYSAEVDAMVESGSVSAEDGEKLMKNFIGTNSSFLNALSTLGGARGISSLLAIMTATDADFESLTAAIEGSEGAAESMSEIMLDNLAGSLTLLNSAIDGLKLAVSDEFKGQIRGFVDTMTEAVGELTSTFQQDGILGVFTKLGDWLIDGITGVLKDDKITQEGAQEFGSAIGEFLGRVINNLITNAPALISGLFEAGINLAKGLVEGMFTGLFGIGNEVDSLKEQLGEEITDVEVNSAKATAITQYLQDLIDKYGEEASKTEAWKAATQELEEVMPGVTNELNAQGESLQANLDKVVAMKDEMRKTAIQEALRKNIQAEYELLGEQERKVAEAETKRDMTQRNVNVIGDAISEMYDEYVKELKKYRMIDNFTDWDAAKRDFENADVEGKLGMLSNIIESLKLGYDFHEVEDEKKIWNKSEEDNLLNPETVKGLSTALTGYQTEIETQNANIKSLNEEISATLEQIDISEKAIERTSQALETTETGVQEAGATAASGIVSAGENLADALNSAAAGLGGGEDGSHAKGLWDVPYDDYVARLHRGEMVLTASQARDYRNGIGGGYDIAGVIAESVKAAVGNLAIVLNDKAVGRTIGDSVSGRVGTNLSNQGKRVSFGYGG